MSLTFADSPRNEPYDLLDLAFERIEHFARIVSQRELGVLLPPFVHCQPESSHACHGCNPKRLGVLGRRPQF